MAQEYLLHCPDCHSTQLEKENKTYECQKCFQNFHYSVKKTKHFEDTLPEKYDIAVIYSTKPKLTDHHTIEGKLLHQFFASHQTLSEFVDAELCQRGVKIYRLTVFTQTKNKKYSELKMEKIARRHQELYKKMMAKNTD